MNTADTRQATADRYYAEGCALVRDVDALLARAAGEPADLSRTTRAVARQKSQLAVSKFNRHDAILDVIAREDA